ncbi:hypothetical protein [Rhizobium sp. SL42]|uniref:hypothetical protein n=1 Tax=Rhizobium sp. SL42 TaxID=2806346 RepID=UPI001F2560E5|nr:hypothetical protein [Rhizobium sp. SL42]UJW73561.1 hypothetical protein IM739_11635 [Rhizobium sp. SL42]
MSHLYVAVAAFEELTRTGFDNLLCNLLNQELDTFCTNFPFEAAALVFCPSKISNFSFKINQLPWQRSNQPKGFDMSRPVFICIPVPWSTKPATITISNLVAGMIVAAVSFIVIAAYIAHEIYIH